jgi:hypothetical protein
MKTKFTLFALIASVSLAVSAGQPPDLTGEGPATFKAHLGKVVTLRGRLEEGKEGPCLFGATPTNVVFYVIPDMPPSGIYTYPGSWERLMHQQVRLTGELKFRSFDRTNKDSEIQASPDCYFMVLQQTTIEGIQSK